MQSKATTPSAYLKSLPADRRAMVGAIRETILKNLPKGYAEGMQYGMIGYAVPHSIYPDGYHCDPTQPVPFAALASQKNYVSLYLNCIYSDPSHLDWFTTEWKKTGLKLDMGKSCIRFKKIEDVPLKLIGQAVKKVPVKKFLAQYEAALANTTTGSRKPATKKKTTKKKITKKSITKKKTTARKTKKS